MTIVSILIIAYFSISFIWFFIFNVSILLGCKIEGRPFLFVFLESCTLFTKSINFGSKTMRSLTLISLFIVIEFFIINFFLKITPDFIFNVVEKELKNKDLVFHKYNTHYAKYEITNPSIFGVCSNFIGYSDFFVLSFLSNLDENLFFHFQSFFNKGSLPLFINKNYTKLNFQEQFINLSSPVSIYQSIEFFNYSQLSKESISKIYASLFFLPDNDDFNFSQKSFIKKEVFFETINQNPELKEDFLIKYMSINLNYDNFIRLITQSNSLKNLLIIKTLLTKYNFDYNEEFLDLINNHHLVRKCSSQIIDEITKD